MIRRIEQPITNIDKSLKTAAKLVMRMETNMRNDEEAMESRDKSNNIVEANYGKHSTHNGQHSDTMTNVQKQHGEHWQSTGKVERQIQIMNNHKRVVI